MLSRYSALHSVWVPITSSVSLALNMLVAGVRPSQGIGRLAELPFPVTRPCVRSATPACDLNSTKAKVSLKRKCENLCSRMTE